MFQEELFDKKFIIQVSLDELLELIKQRQIIDEQRKALESQIESIEQDESADKSLSLQLSVRRGVLSRQSSSFREQIRKIKDEMSKKIAQSENVFAILDFIYKADPELARSINQAVVSYGNFFRKNLAEEIKSIYGIEKDKHLNIVAKERGVSEGFIVESDDRKFYVKESLTYRQEKRINPKELFVYKLLEYAKFGPKTHFIIKPYSTSKSGSNICYIVTQDVQYSKDSLKTKSFVTDNIHIEDCDQEQKTKQWQESLENEEFIIDFLALSMLDDTFTLNDSFRSNADNYGSLKIMNPSKELCKYKPLMIDHLPDCKNVKFEYKSISDAIQSLIHKLRINSQIRESKRKPPTVCYSFFEKRRGMDTEQCFKTIEKLACSRLINGKPGKENSSILDAMKLAIQDIKNLIEQFPDSFVNDAINVLQEYCGRCCVNIERLKLLSSTSATELPASSIATLTV